MKVLSMWVGLAAVALMAGAFVERFAPECTQPICWGGASPGLLLILAGVLASITLNATLPALVTARRCTTGTSWARRTPITSSWPSALGATSF
jgi:hypothetical protein